MDDVSTFVDCVGTPEWGRAAHFLFSLLFLHGFSRLAPSAVLKLKERIGFFSD